MAITRADFPLPDVDDSLTAGFFAAPARGELCIPRCEECGRWCWYPPETQPPHEARGPAGGRRSRPEEQQVCPACEGPLVWTRTAGRARLFSWAVVQRAFLPAFADMVPFVTALVALEEDPAVRIVTYVVDAVPGSLHGGMPLEVVFRPLRFPTVPDRQVVVPMFRPVA
ncbi:MAG: hypothetical protein FJW88_13065 [Actinobacteria bacterium]|nr:hypothetical protein [Actinomycetota bacterium]